MKSLRERGGKQGRAFILDLLYSIDHILRQDHQVKDLPKQWLATWNPIQIQQ